MNATTILLEPLTADDSAELVGNLINDKTLARAVQGRIGETAEGNPLFVEELVAMLVDEGVIRRVDGGWQSEADLSQPVCSAKQFSVSALRPTIRRDFGIGG